MIAKVVIMAACAVMVASHPVEKQPVLKPAPSEVLYRVDSKDRVVLECATTEDNNDVVYTWLKNGKEMESVPETYLERGNLIFRNIKPEDEGQYQCFAKSEAGVASTRVINLRRAYLDAPATPVSKKHKAVEGKPFKLDCHIPKSYPKPEITWVKQSLSNPSEPVVQIRDHRITVGPTGDLFFANLTVEDAESTYKYVCLATSPAFDGEVKLAEHWFPEALQPNTEPENHEVIPQYLSEDMVAKVGSVTMIYCIYGGSPLAHPDWFKGDKNVNNSPKDRVTRYNRTAGKRLLIKETWLEDQGTYTCVADNEVSRPKKHTIHLTVVGAPNFTAPIEPKILVKQGQDVTIPCSITGFPAPKVSWSYNAQPLPLNEKFAIKSESASSKVVADLTIKNVQKTDQGYYGCKGLNEHGEDYAETLLVVAPYAYPLWYDKTGKNVNNSPKDRITSYNWTAGKRLLIKDTWLEDEGTYTCVINNKLGKAKNHTIHLTVVGAPNITELLEPKVLAKEEQDVILHCRIYGFPAPKVIWTYNTKPLPDDDRFSVVSEGTTFNKTVADLNIKKVQGTDKGYYGCRGLNEYGEDYGESLLVVA